MFIFAMYLGGGVDSPGTTGVEFNFVGKTRIRIGGGGGGEVKSGSLSSSVFHFLNDLFLSLIM